MTAETHIGRVEAGGYQMQIPGTVGRYRMQEHASLKVGEVPKRK